MEITTTPLPVESRNRNGWILVCDAVFSGLVIVEWIHSGEGHRHPSVYKSEEDAWSSNEGDSDSDVWPISCWVSGDGLITLDTGQAWDGNAEGCLSWANST